MKINSTTALVAGCIGAAGVTGFGATKLTELFLRKCFGNKASEGDNKANESKLKERLITISSIAIGCVSFVGVAAVSLTLLGLASIATEIGMEFFRRW